jgi:CRISPR-associated protein Cas5d
MSDSLEVAFEVAGPAAMFTRPDTGATPISYPVPTWSAAKAMFDAVARLHYSNGSAWIHPTCVEICEPIRYERYVTNYGGPLRKQDQIKKNNNYQLHATILVEVCYRIYGEVRTKRSTRGKGIDRKKQRTGKRNPQQELYDLFTTRMANDQTFYTPCLGWKEFVPTYFGPLRPETKPETSINEVIPSLLVSMWKHGQLKPHFVQDWHIVKGVMSYEHQTPPAGVCHAQ